MGRGSISTGQTITASDALFLGKSKIITASRGNVASGQVAYTGVSFEPRTVVALSWTASNPNNSGSFGFGDENLAERDLYIKDFGSSDHLVGGEAYLISMYFGATASNYQKALLVTLDSNGFTLDWERGGASPPNGDLAFLCLG